MWAATQAAKELKAGQRCVVILPDSIRFPRGRKDFYDVSNTARNYMTKFLNDDWMVDRGLMEPTLPHEWWSEKTVADLQLPSAVTVRSRCFFSHHSTHSDSPDPSLGDCGGRHCTRSAQGF